MPVFGLIDANSFYCSCQRAFDPALKRRPVVVLSNNDGCAIARTKEAKALGIKMGDAWHLIRKDRKLAGVEWLSSNYPLYADMSRRVFEVLTDLVPRVEPYSIDEMFLDLSGINDLESLCVKLRQDVSQITKIPTCVGWGPTKTIAKLANAIAKDRPELEGVCDLTGAGARERYYRNLDVGEVWGIGRRSVEKLHASNIRTISHYVDADEKLIRAISGILGERIQSELRGDSCLRLSDMAPQRQGVSCTRSFGRPITEPEEMREAVCGFATRAAEKLRGEGLEGGHIAVFIQTSPHARQWGWYSGQRALSIPATNDTLVMVRHATRLLREIWRPGYRYIKAGVHLTDLSPDGAQASLLEPRNMAAESAMRAMDEINQRYGKQVLRPASIGVNRNWSPRQNMLSPRYTTKLAEIMVAGTF
ncbi:Y-family DNA polymerase [Acetobacter sacchari]|uniref:DNA-directed DNA polymerase n=1 Tax=Acetobacter sacchari TaxID=2661687 RepID=A0ABS3LWL9_9PROT|nr:Y-family DNA polymerase [Acetobacter sacchari]MBO1360288.1 Y-family DNA polymerase [Acetobacter sacchari]